MIFAYCPLCDESIVLPIAKAGAFEKINCPNCGVVLFLHHSRWRPHVYTEDQVEVDEDTKTIQIINADALCEFCADYEEAANLLVELSCIADAGRKKGEDNE